MTRNTPQPPPQGYDGSGHGYQPPQYGGNEPHRGSYHSGEVYGQHNPSWQQQQQQPPYPGEQQGSAQSYYGSNDQPYQQYPPQYGDSEYGAQTYAGEPYQQRYHSGPYPTYGGHSQDYSQQGYPPQEQYGGHPPYSAPAAGSDVEAFKSHYEAPHGPIDPSTIQPPPPDAEGDRGVMGALAGGAAGAYGGHKMHHGFLGGIGGAVAGSMLEDAYKKHNKKEKKEKKHREGKPWKQHKGSHSGSSSSSSSGSSDSSGDEKKAKKRAAGAAALAGNFHASSNNMRLEGRCTLVADCKDKNGRRRQSTLDLNNCFTNTVGDLRWARGGNFAATARHIKLVDGGRAIEAELGDGRGGWKHNVVRLGERITNDNGALAML